MENREVAMYLALIIALGLACIFAIILVARGGHL